MATSAFDPLQSAHDNSKLLIREHFRPLYFPPEAIVTQPVHPLWAVGEEPRRSHISTKPQEDLLTRRKARSKRVSRYES